MNDIIALKLKQLPKKPGVYIMKNIDNNIIYVGKAINLKNRVRQYFDNSKNKSTKVVSMVSNINDFEYIIVENEIEALILESNLIKKNRPKYNVVLRDDKQYPFIKISKEKFPRLMKVRKIKNDGAKYFGPFPEVIFVNNVVKFFQEKYKIRTCNLNFDKNQKLDRPCLNYYIKLCEGPCVYNIDEHKYNYNISRIEDYLKGKNSDVLSEINDEMLKYSQMLEFEKAMKIKNHLESLKALIKKQKITSLNDNDIDIIAIYKEKKDINIQIFYIRQGKIIDRKNFMLKDEFNTSKEEILSSFIKQFYINITYVPREIIIEYEPVDIDIIKNFLEEKRGYKVDIRVPKKGRKKDLLNMAVENAKDNIKKLELNKNLKLAKKILPINQLEKLLNIKSINRIESYDISNISGTNSVGSMIVYENNNFKKNDYRKFKIKTVNGIDDYSSMKEVLTRRFNRYFKEKSECIHSSFSNLPSLILMDGGKGQINIAKKVIEDFNLNIPVAGLVKDEFHTTRAIIYDNIEYDLYKEFNLYKFLYSIQEEVHRFAIDYHRKLRNSQLISSELDNIIGIGLNKKKNLFKYFKSIDNIKNASIEELQKVELIGKKQAHKIFEYFNRGDDDAKE